MKEREREWGRDRQTKTEKNGGGERVRERDSQRQHHSAVVNSKAVQGIVLNTVRQTDTDSITQQS